MDKKLLEQIMMDSERQTGSIGPKSKDESDSAVQVSNNRSLQNKDSFVMNPLMPAEISDVIRFTGDILEKTVQLRDLFLKALNNPSISKIEDRSKYYALKKSILALDEINGLLAKDIPEYLEIFR